MDHDEKLIMLSGAIFISIVVFVFIINYAFKDETINNQAYEFKENETIRITGITTATTQRRTIPILCKNAQENDECNNLTKFKLTKKECCRIGYCCENAG